MGLTYISVTARHVADRSKSFTIDRVLVDTGAEATWLPRDMLNMLGVAVETDARTYVTADGRSLTRAVGYLVLECDPNFKTVDEVVFAEPNDMKLLGARTLEGFHATVDPTNKRLVAAGPGLAAGNYEKPSEN
jgi:predicted aspartyl protease